MTGKVVGKGGGSKVCRRTVGFRGIAFVGREASGGSAVGALTAVEDLGQVVSHKVRELALALRLGAFQHPTRVLHLYNIAQSGAV